MAQYTKAQVTQLGHNLNAKVLGNEPHVLEFTRIVTSDTDYSSNNLVLLEGITNIRQTGSLSGTVVQDNQFNVKGTFDTADIESGYYMRTIALYANDPDKGEILYAVVACDPADYIHSRGDVGDSIIHFDFAIKVTGAQNVTITIPTSGLITVHELNDIKNDMDNKFEGLEDETNSNFSSLSADIDQRFQTKSGELNTSFTNLSNNLTTRIDNEVDELADDFGEFKTTTQGEINTFKSAAQDDIDNKTAAMQSSVTSSINSMNSQMDTHTTNFNNLTTLVDNKIDDLEDGFGVFKTATQSEIDAFKTAAQADIDSKTAAMQSSVTSNINSMNSQMATHTTNVNDLISEGEDLYGDMRTQSTQLDTKFTNKSSELDTKFDNLEDTYVARVDTLETLQADLTQAVQVGGQNVLALPYDWSDENANYKFAIENGVIKWTQKTTAMVGLDIPSHAPDRVADYVFSMKASHDQFIRNMLQNGVGQTRTGDLTIVDKGDHYFISLQLPEFNPRDAIYFYGTNPYSPIQEVHFWDLKLEEGTMPTAYSRAIEDLMWDIGDLMWELEAVDDNLTAGLDARYTKDEVDNKLDLKADTERVDTLQAKLTHAIRGGGRNLVLLKDATDYYLQSNNSNTTPILDEAYGNHRRVKRVFTGDGQPANISTYSSQRLGNIVAGEDYVLALWVKPEESMRLEVWGARTHAPTIDCPAGEWTMVWGVSTSSNNRILLPGIVSEEIFSPDFTPWIEYKDPMVVKGSIPPAFYTRAPEDIDNEVKTLEDRIKILEDAILGN